MTIFCETLTQETYYYVEVDANVGMQPDTLTTVLESSNLFFSSMFAVEMLLKMIADGFFGYVKNGFNLFDSFIVILRFDRFHEMNTHYFANIEPFNSHFSRLSEFSGGSLKYV